MKKKGIGIFRQRYMCPFPHHNSQLSSLQFEHYKSNLSQGPL